MAPRRSLIRRAELPLRLVSPADAPPTQIRAAGLRDTTRHLPRTSFPDLTSADNMPLCVGKRPEIPLTHTAAGERAFRGLTLALASFFALTGRRRTCRMPAGLKLIARYVMRRLFLSASPSSRRVMAFLRLTACPSKYATQVSPPIKA